MNTERATILARWPSGSLCYFPCFTGEPEELHARIDFVRKFQGHGFIPLAWVPHEAGRTGTLATMFETATAAGRLIDCINGKYVPRIPGEEKPAKPRSILDIEKKRAPLTWNTPKPFDPFPGFSSSYDGQDSQPADRSGHALQRFTDADRAILKS